MSLIIYIDRIKRIDGLIRRKATGTPTTFADKMGISKRRIYEYIVELKELGAPIEYNRNRGSYEYAEDGFFDISFHKRDKK